MSKEGVKKTQGYRESRKRVQLEERVIEGVLVEGKKCSACGEWKSLTEYWQHLKCIGGRSAKCKVCIGVKGRKTPEKWTNYRFDALLDPGWERLDEVGKAIEKVDVLCPNKHRTTIRPSDLKSNKHGCKECSNAARVTYTDEMIDAIISEFKIGWKRIGSTFDDKTKILVMCPNGHESHISKYGLKDYGCRKCYYESRKIWDNIFFDKLLKEYRKGWKRVGDVINGSSPVEVICSSGHRTALYPFSLKSNDGECYECSNLKRRKYDNTHFDSLLELNLPGWTRNHEFSVNLCTDDVEVICPKGHVNTLKAYNVNRRNVCKECWKLDRINADIEEDVRITRRMIPGYIEWRKSVYERDDFTCQCCNDDKGGNLVAHHLDGYHWCEEKRTDIDNGVTLCDTCHKDFHNKYGVKNNTKDQYVEWLKNKKLSEIGNRSIREADGGNRRAI
jgi:rhodanese-related sulfurtransferase